MERKSLLDRYCPQARPRKIMLQYSSRSRRIFSLHVIVVVLVLAMVLESSMVLALATSSSVSKTTPPYAGVGKSIPILASWTEGLELAKLFWLPTDDDLPPHFSQKVHHETRQRWAGQLLQALARQSSNYSWDLVSDHDGLSRLIHAAATPYQDPKTNEIEADRVTKEGVWLVDALQGIYGILGRQLYHAQQSYSTSDHMLSKDILQGIRDLMARANALGDQYSLDQACRVHWAIQGLQTRVPDLQDKSSAVGRDAASTLQERVEALPFSIVPLGVDWQESLPLSSISNDDSLCERLLDAIPFSKDTITTRSGESVQERRGTAWIAETGIGALAYSGKLMPPQPIPDVVRSVMRSVEYKLDLENGFFDCALCNHYADAGSACKFHTDPEHGLMWDRTTIVVAAGSDRTFAFKPIDTKWDAWDPVQVGASQSSTAATTHLFAGDLVVMRENCNDDFYHAVHTGESDDDRVSLVFKRGIGPKGHGLVGQGRRSKRKRQQRR